MFKCTSAFSTASYIQLKVKNSNVKYIVPWIIDKHNYIYVEVTSLIKATVENGVGVFDSKYKIKYIILE